MFPDFVSGSRAQFPDALCFINRRSSQGAAGSPQGSLCVHAEARSLAADGRELQRSNWGQRKKRLAEAGGLLGPDEPLWPEKESTDPQQVP